MNTHDVDPDILRFLGRQEQMTYGKNYMRKDNMDKNIQQLVNFDDNRTNIILLGTSGCGKSTLINALLKSEKAKVGIGKPITDQITVYEADDLPYRFIDTVGLEFNILHQIKIRHDLQKFCRSGVKQGAAEKLIHMIWFCVDGAHGKLEPVVLDYISSVSNDWKNVPVVFVVTKSFAETKTEELCNMVEDLVGEYNTTHPKKSINIKAIVPIVAQALQINDEYTVPARGLEELISVTNDLVPQAQKIAKSMLSGIDLKLKRQSSGAFIALSTISAVTMGAVPVPVPDSAMLVPLQTYMMNHLASIYSVNESKNYNAIKEVIASAGLATIAGRNLVNGLKAIPGLNIAGAVLNAATAGLVTFTMGELCQAMCEKVYTGEIVDVSQINNEEILKVFNIDIMNGVKKFGEYFNKPGRALTVENINGFIKTLNK